MSVTPLHPRPLPSQKWQRSPRKPNKRTNTRQAKNMMEGLAHAREIGTLLNAHLIIHWGGTGSGDDPDGSRFAKFRHLLDKRLKRQGIRGGLTAIWVLERHRNKRTHHFSEVVHSHLLLHLPRHFERSPYREAFERVVEELVTLVGDGILGVRTIALTFPNNPDGKYFLKGATRPVWDRYNSPDKWRSKRGEGVIDGKRCGTTQNIGAKARERWWKQQSETVSWLA
ncbi:MAG: hypothetical protein ACTSP0_08905 [Alphaproteobacteria bacterium]